jgi:hypothetical protein
MILKKGLHVLLFCVLGNSLIAQNTQFNKAYQPIPGLSAISFSVQNAPSGNIVYGGTVDSNNHQDVALVKIDSAGNVLWKKSYNKIGYNFAPDGTANEIGVVVPWGGEIGVADWEIDTSSSFAYWSLYRFDAIGDTIWTKNYHDSTDIVMDQLKITRDKKYLIYGEWWNTADINNTFCTLLLIKTDSLGNEILRRTYHDTTSHVRISSGLDTCRDGGYVLCAYAYDTNANYSRVGCDSGRIMVMKTDSTGNTQWITYIPDTLCDVRAFSIKTLRHGGYVVSGFWDDSLNWNGEIPYSIMYMAKLNDSGNVVWHRTYGVHWSQEGSNTLYSVNEVPNGDLVVCGNAELVDTLFYFGAILRADSNGNQKWLNYYEKLNTTDEDYLTDIQLTPAGGFISSGYTFGNPGEIWVIKTDSLGCDSGCDDEVTEIRELRGKSKEVRVFPNPSNGIFTIQSSFVSSQLSVEIYNVLGEKIYTETLSQTQDNTINLIRQPNGVYQYRVLKEDGELVGEGKVVIEK